MRSSLVFWGRTKTSRGVALMITLFISVIVFVIMTSLLLYTRREYQVSGGGLDAIKAQYAADAGVEYFMANLQKQMADDPTKFKLYYFPESNTALYDAKDLSISAWVVPSGWPKSRYTNPYGNYDDPEWRWVFRYTKDINNLIATNKELAPGQTFTIKSARLKDSTDYNIYSILGVEPFLNRPTTWWQDHPYIIESVGQVGGASIVSQRTYKAEIRYFSQRKPENFYYEVNY